MAMKILFVASELTPLAKVGGLGDVIGSLPKALNKTGLKLAVIMPKYAAIDNKKWRLKKILEFVESGEKLTVYKTTIPKSLVPVYLVENKKYISRGPIYFQKTAFAGSKREIDRFVFFSKAVYKMLKERFIDADIVHCHDWHTGALVRSLRFSDVGPQTIFTIHNLANQGKSGRFNGMREGINNADMVTTVSPTYAKEITTKKYSVGLEQILRKRARQGKLVGIINGIDIGFFDPQKDNMIDHKYSSSTLARKNKNKITLQKISKLKVDHKAPIFGLVSRLTAQKGIMLIPPIVSEHVEKHNAQFVFLGTGSKSHEEKLLELAKRYPQNVSTNILFDEVMAHKIYAGCDFFLMPSRFEPSGLGQMISMRYGTPPIVRVTGGLKDTVRHLETGFMFQKESAAALKKATEAAIAILRDEKLYRQMQRRCMKEDFSWDKSAAKYKEIYQKMLK
ncbi:MAG: glycogen/starch synthase [bacterium]|nr:glycogen/starch synthase [bacterium]